MISFRILNLGSCPFRFNLIIPHISEKKKYPTLPFKRYRKSKSGIYTSLSTDFISVEKRRNYHPLFSI